MSNPASQMEDIRKRPLHKLVTSDYYYLHVREKLKSPSKSPDKRDCRGYTLLHLAARSCEKTSKIVDLLIEKDAVLDCTTPSGQTPLHFAVCNRKLDIVDALLEAGACVNSKNSRGRTALHLSVWSSISTDPDTKSNISVVERLLSHPNTILDATDEEIETPLLLAVRERNRKVVKALLKKGANPNIPNARRQTPLHVALSARKPSYSTVKLLLTNGAGIYCKDASGETPMDLLIRFIQVHSDDPSRAFASRYLALIALRYKIRESLQNHAERIPWVREYFKELCREVGLMGVVRVHAKVTLHDFVLDLFQERVQNPVSTIYTPLVEALLTGLFTNYLEFILFKISSENLRRVLEETVGRETALELAPEDATNFDISVAISRYYDENEELSDRVLEYRKFLLKKM